MCVRERCKTHQVTWCLGVRHTHMQRRSWCCGRVNKSRLLDLISLITRFIMLIWEYTVN